MLDRLRGTLPNRYTVEGVLGRGGTATVFAGRDRQDERDVAIKVLRPEFALTLMAERFHREIEILRRLDHPHILPLLESGERDGLYYFIMPFAHGETLARRVDRQGPLPLTDVLRITGDLAAAIDHAHRHGVIHRDITPSNVVFEGSRAIVCDFGIAKVIVTAGGETFSSSGLAIGTPEYMSPEQARGESELTGAVDIYALGCVVFTALVGEPPFRGPTAQAVIARHAHARPPSLRIVRPDVPEEVERAVNWALAKHPGERPASGAEFASAMQGAS